MIQADGIFTPWRAYQRRGTLPNCGYCGHEQCDFEHLLWECKETHLDKTPQFEWLKKERGNAPDQKCLWNTGNVGKGFLQYPQSKQMQSKEQYDRPGVITQDNQVTTVFTDGGCVKVMGGNRAGYGIYWGEQDRRNESRALNGNNRQPNELK